MIFRWPDIFHFFFRIELFFLNDNLESNFNYCCCSCVIMNFNKYSVIKKEQTESSIWIEIINENSILLYKPSPCGLSICFYICTTCFIQYMLVFSHENITKKEIRSVVNCMVVKAKQSKRRISDYDYYWIIKTNKRNIIQ